MITTKIRDIAVAVLCLTLAVCSIITTRRASRTLDNLDGATGEVRRSAEIARGYIEFQNERFRSEKNQKALEAGYQTPAVLNGTLRLINTQTIPRIHRNLDSLVETQADMRDAVRSLTELVRNTDHSINQVLVPEIAEVARAAGVEIQELTAEIKQLVRAGEVGLSEVNALLSSPEWLETLKNLARASANADGLLVEVRKIASHIEEGARRAPEIAESLEKIAKTSSKFTKITLIANIIGVLARAFLP